MHSRHPLRRHYALELALGFAVALGAAWALLRDPPAARGERERSRASGPDLEERAPAPLASPEVPRDGARPARPQREDATPPAPTSSSPARAAPIEASPSPPAALDALEVLVRDEQGRPVPGVALALELRDSPSLRGQARTAPVTGPEGRTLVPLAWFEPVQGVAAPLHVLRPLVPLREPPTLEFRRPPAPGLVLLTLPVGGRLRVRVLDEEGQDIERGADVHATLRDAEGELRATAEVREGVAELPWIPLDALLELRATRTDQSATSERLRLRGPGFPGEVVERELRLGEWPLLSFRVVDERGEPLARMELALHTSLAPLSPHVTRARSALDGGVEFRLVARHEAEGERVLQITAAQPRARVGEVRLPYRLERGAPTELGDVVLRPGIPER